MRVLFVDHVGVLGGAELSLLDLARHYRDRSQVVLFADGPFREVLMAEGVPVRVLPVPARLAAVAREDGWSGLAALPAVWSAARRLAALAADAQVVHCNSQKAFVVGALAGWLARRPVVWHLRDMLTAEHFSALHRRLAVGLANRFAAKVIANSQATARAFAAAGGRPDLAVVVYNGIDPGAFPDREPAEARSALGLGPGPLVGSFSRLAPWKGQHVLLEALAHLPGVRAIVVGEALFREQAYAEGLRRRAAELGIAGRVQFLGFRRDVPALMAACDVVVHTSTAPEPFGRMIVEAQLAGRPVVASRDGGVVELVEHGETGLLVPPGDPQALAAAIRELLEDPARAARLAEQGRRSARARFSRERMLADFEAVLRQVLAARRDPGA